MGSWHFERLTDTYIFVCPHLSSKRSGGFDDGRYQERCVFIQPSFMTDGMRAYFASEKWQELIRWDQVLYAAVNRSLDLTIKSLGHAKFQKNLAKFQIMKKQITELCADEIRLPCDQNGTLILPNETSCIFHDMGCGFDCMDREIPNLPKPNLKEYLKQMKLQESANEF